MPFFSIVIPLYNKEKYVGATLQSVLAQTFSDFEVVIVNDGSTDGSREAVKAFDDPRIRYCEKTNGGVSTARNFGIEKAAAQWIALLDADDYWYPDFLATMRRNIDDFPAEKVFSAAIEMGAARTAARYSIPRKPRRQVVDYFEASFRETAVCTSCVVLHRSVFGAVGYFDTEIRSGQDTDLWIRIGIKYKVVFDWKILARYTDAGQSLSKNLAYTPTRIRFEKFALEEKRNRALGKFLDLNRFSIAIKSKLNGDAHYFSTLRRQIDPAHLSVPKKIALALPAGALRKLIRFQRLLLRWGLVSSAFK
jgi:glycosyltransferase involved in cell wall biosynthesis